MEQYSMAQLATGEWQVQLYAPSGRLVRTYILNNYELARERVLDWLLYGNGAGELSAPMPNYIPDDDGTILFTGGATC